MTDIDAPFVDYLWEGNTLERGRLVSDGFVTFDYRYIRSEWDWLLELRPQLKRIHTQTQALNIREGVCIPSSMYKVCCLGWTYHSGNLVCLMQQEEEKQNFFVFDALRVCFILRVVWGADPPTLWVSLRGREPSLIVMQGNKVMAMTPALPSEYFKIQNIPAFIAVAKEVENGIHQQDARASNGSSIRDREVELPTDTAKYEELRQDSSNETQTERININDTGDPE